MVRDIERMCGDCPALHPTESEQTERKEPHWCHILKRRLMHEGMHPQIPTPDDCPLEEDEMDYIL